MTCYSYFNYGVARVVLIIWKGDLKLEGYVESGDLGPGFGDDNGGDYNINDNIMLMKIHN